MSRESRPLMDFEGRLGETLRYRFRRPELLLQAISHKSFFPVPGADNEKLEFLGDAVLGLVLAEILMREFPRDDEGGLSKKRAGLVNEANLALVARQLGLGELLRLGKSEILTNGENKPRLLASALEAVLGAVYLDGGYEPVKELIERIFLPLIREGDASSHFSRDYKTQLQEYIQARDRQTPTYRVLKEEGPSHARIFRVCVEVGGKIHGEAEGTSKKSAEQAAARMALQLLGVIS